MTFTPVQVLIASNISELKSIDVTKCTEGQIINVLGYDTINDGGGGLFQYFKSSAKEDGGIVFTPNSGSGHFRRLYDTLFVRAEWFGAKGNDYTNKKLSDIPDSTSAIQRAIDYALQNHIQEVKLGDGIFRITDTLQLGYGLTFNSISLTGTGSRYGAVAAFGGTAIFADFNDRPALAIQGARYSSVKALTLQGRNFDDIQQKFSFETDPVKQAEMIMNPSTYVDPSFPKSADSHCAPYAAIAIDPYSGSRPSEEAGVYPNVTFPDWIKKQFPNWFKDENKDKVQYNKSFSSGVLIENVHINGFVVGIVNQPCNADGNGDFTKIHNCVFGYLK
jgi:hypothetical protein